MPVNWERFAVTLAGTITMSVFAAGLTNAQENNASVLSGKAQPSAPTLIKAAVRKAGRSGRIVLVHFGASWCPWCKRLDTFLNTPEMSKLLAGSYVVVKLDAFEQDDKKALQNPGADKIFVEMGAARSGLPFYAFLDKNGRRIADSNSLPGGANIGYPATAAEIQVFGELLRRTAPRMSAVQRTQIMAYLTRNAPARR